MATDQPFQRSDLDSVRYPSEVLSSLDSFVSNLRRRILASAGRAAIERSEHGSASFIVSSEDLLTATRAAIPNALAELEKALAHRESFHVKRAS